MLCRDCKHICEMKVVLHYIKKERPPCKCPVSVQPGEELINFKKLFDEEVRKVRATNPSVLQNHQSLHQFGEAIWRVHHAGRVYYSEKERPPCWCPVAGCPKMLRPRRVVCETVTRILIDEYHSYNTQTASPALQLWFRFHRFHGARRRCK
ncbi:hypothetical protein MKW98_013527 [Papaver atlanticum]|uniref:Uncharacterized protein n=1 Tax=Papaver atlanticum TaxID=357466 RepID=A0AAD4SV84_9MAGN|nr:hypothetical protein MKW98_013527 [Papaver atlanticum]